MINQVGRQQSSHKTQMEQKAVWKNTEKIKQVVLCADPIGQSLIMFYPLEKPQIMKGETRKISHVRLPIFHCFKALSFSKTSYPDERKSVIEALCCCCRENLNFIHFFRAAIILLKTNLATHWIYGMTGKLARLQKSMTQKVKWVLLQMLDCHCFVFCPAVSIFAHSS